MPHNLFYVRAILKSKSFSPSVLQPSSLFFVVRTPEWTGSISVHEYPLRSISLPRPHYPLIPTPTPRTQSARISFADKCLRNSSRQSLHSDNNHFSVSFFRSILRFSFLSCQPYGITFKFKNVIREVLTRDRCRVDAISMKWIPLWRTVNSWRPQQNINLATMAYLTIKINWALSQTSASPMPVMPVAPMTTQKITMRNNKMR